MNTCPAHRMSTGRPGRHGNAAPCLAAVASSRDAEPVRMAMTVPDVVRYVTQNNRPHKQCSCIRPSLYPFIVRISAWAPWIRWAVSGDEIGTSNTTKSPGYIYTVAAAIRFITKTYLIPHTHTVITPHMNRLIFCHKAFSKARMMQGSAEIRAFPLLTELCDAQCYFWCYFDTHTHSLIRSTGKNKREWTWYL